MSETHPDTLYSLGKWSADTHRHTHARDSFGVLDALFPLEYRKAEERRQAKNDSDSTHGDLQLPGFPVTVEVAETACGDLH